MEAMERRGKLAAIAAIMFIVFWSQCEYLYYLNLINCLIIGHKRCSQKTKPVNRLSSHTSTFYKNKKINKSKIKIQNSSKLNSKN